MKKLKFNLFKTLIIIFLFGFLFVFYQYSQNGRFDPINRTYGNAFVIDTRTGTIYIYKLEQGANILNYDHKIKIKKD